MMKRSVSSTVEDSDPPSGAGGRGAGRGQTSDGQVVRLDKSET
ncbi:unnamed protein product, partial [Amoebophrya sp. A25]|eukprot:GSA25T00001566001.1